MSMTKYREILSLSSLNLSQQNIADSCNVSKKTVNRVLKRAKELGISWPLDANETNAVLAEKFFPSAKQVKTNKRMPDYDYIRKELLRMLWSSIFVTFVAKKIIGLLLGYYQSLPCM